MSESACQTEQVCLANLFWRPSHPRARRPLSREALLCYLAHEGVLAQLLLRHGGKEEREAADKAGKKQHDGPKLSTSRALGKQQVGTDLSSFCHRRQGQELFLQACKAHINEAEVERKASRWRGFDRIAVVACGREAACH